MSNARKYTCELIDMAESGSISWETIARECLCYMSEYDVKDMSGSNDWTSFSEEEDK